MPVVPRPRKLEIGCGYRPTPGWFRWDANPNIPKLDLCGAADQPTDLPDGSFDEIRAVDVLEHITYRRTQVALAEWARLLAPGGTLYVQVPDVRAAIERWLADPGSMRPPGVPDHLPDILGLSWRLLGGHLDESYAKGDDDFRWNAHYALFDHESLTWYLEDAGLKVVRMETNPHPNILCWATK